MWKKAVVLLVLSVLLLLCACGSKENAIVGEWHFVEDESSTDSIKGKDKYNDSSSLHFDGSNAFFIYSDGTWVVEEPNKKNSGTYSIVNDGAAISFVWTSKRDTRIESINFTVFNGNRLVLTQNGKTLVFTK